MARSGNNHRGGRPKGSLATHTLQTQEAKKALIAMYVENQKDIDQALIDKAKDGDVPAIREVYDRVYGSSKESMEIAVERLDISDEQLTQLIAARTARADNN